MIMIISKAFKPTFLRTAALYLFVALLLTTSFSVLGQETQLLQVKTFNEQLQPYKNIRISINGNSYFSTGEKGVTFSEISNAELPVKSIKVENEQLEAASWNHSKGTLEVIIRKKSYRLVSVIVQLADQSGIANLNFIFKGKKTITATTNKEGLAEIPLALDEKVRSAEQFVIQDYQIAQLQSEGERHVLIVDPIQITQTVEEVTTTVDAPASEEVPEDFFADFDLTKLDSIQSLTAFYAIFKNYDREDLSPEASRRVDAKFDQLVGQLQDSVRKNELSFIGKITDSTVVRNDIENLLAQARLESQMLVVQETEFEKKIELIHDKLTADFESLDADARAGLLSDLNLLEKILTENENRFYKNQNNYRTIISNLQDKFFDLETLENKLSVSEAQRLEEQRIFRQRLLGILCIVAVFAILIILLIYFSNKLKKQKRQLILANDEIKRVNENLEGLVYERTKMLIETNRELDTVLYRASHDLRSPVRSIIGLCNIANSLSNGESKEVIEKVVQTSADMDRLLKKLSVISEINEPNNFSSVSLYEVIGDILNSFDQMIQDYGINFIIECPADLKINTYPNLIEIILVNLIENALFYCMLKNSKESQVQLTITTDGQHLELTLLDNGVGFENAIGDKVFEMFFKGHERSKGNGLGLYIVQKSVHALKGKITVESEPGNFAKFIVLLPLKEVEEEQVVSIAEA